MCGRFTRHYTWQQIQRMYGLIAPASNLQPRFNICPTTNVDAVVARDGQRELLSMRWGLVPNWWNKPLKEMKLATFNARAETVMEKPIFRDASRRSRCLIPVSGYYEWQNTPEGKQPYYYFTRRDGEVMTIAALWDEWTDKASGETLKSCCMVIKEANRLVAQVHDRMPVILKPKDFQQWEQGQPQARPPFCGPRRTTSCKRGRCRSA
jgi:putative SOS response-associated peptidase YedK